MSTIPRRSEALMVIRTEAAHDGATEKRTTTVVPDRLEDLTASASVWTRALRFEHDRLRGWQQNFG